MDVVWLARLQFSLTIMFHFLFPPISIGLGFLIFLLEAARWRTGRDVYRRASDFWLKIFAINFSVGVASGIVMEFQFGTNWAGYSRFVGDIFGAPLAAEGILAFFLESSFLGLLLFGRRRMSSTVRWFAAAMVSLGTVLSAFWILVANSWMQTPAGYRIESGRALLTDFRAAVLNPSTLPRVAHTLSSSLCMGAFVMAGVASWYVRRGRHPGVSRASLRLGVVAAFAGVLLVFLSGDRHARQVAHTQHAKFAAMEGVFSTEKGAPLILFALPPTQTGPRPGPEIVITSLTSKLAFGNFQAPVEGLKNFPTEDWPPVAVTFLAFHNMVIVANLIGFVALTGFVLLLARKLEGARWWQGLMIVSVPLPMIAIQLGWLTAEVGRQPWIVYGILRTKDGVSKVVGAPEILFSIILFSLLYACLGALWLFLILRAIRKGPEPATLPGVEEEARHAVA
jgi:cytochrome bd ubiquinol oxidase subunit I